MRKDDLIRIHHMLDSAKEALLFSKNKTRNNLNKDRILSLSLVKTIEIIGEAASKITKETKDNHPEIPWANIVAMRNKLIHAYYDIDLDRLWDTVTDDLPPLVNALEIILTDSFKVREPEAKYTAKRKKRK